MVKYTLTKQHLSKDNLNRLTKTIIDNCQKDRQAAIELLDDIKARVTASTAPFEYSDLIKNATSVLKQIQEVNTTVVKVMSIMQSVVIKTTPARKSDSVEVDLFEGLSKLTKVDDGKEDNES